MSAARQSGQAGTPPYLDLDVKRSARLRALKREGVTDFWELCRRAKGADPVSVAKHLGELPRGAPMSPRANRIGPEESPGRAEWYFTKATCLEVDRLLPGRLLCLGVPTMAASRVANVVLVDDSPWLAERFDFFSNDWICSDVGETHLGQSFDSAILDPPWYGDNLLDWLQFASAHVVEGGVIALPLMGENTRPSAAVDRERIMGAATQIGAIELHRDRVTYEVPSFEMHAFLNAGFNGVEEWRRADLLLVRNSSPVRSPRVPVGQSEWFDLRVQKRIISVRKRVIESSQGLQVPFVSPLENDYLLATISRRDPKLARSSFWTSNSRVGKVDDYMRFKQFLDRCSRSLTGNVQLERSELEVAARVGLDFVVEDS